MNILCYGRREFYVHVLKQHSNIDIFGKCGKPFCPFDQLNDCYERIELDYKFYLSFENSLCRDYVNHYNSAMCGTIVLLYYILSDNRKVLQFTRPEHRTNCLWCWQLRSDCSAAFVHRRSQVYTRSTSKVSRHSWQKRHPLQRIFLVETLLQVSDWPNIKKRATCVTYNTLSVLLLGQISLRL